MNGIIVSSPLQTEALKDLNKPMFLIDHPVLNRRTKHYPVSHDPVVKIIFEGFLLGSGFMRILHPVIGKLREETGKDIRFIYYSSTPYRKDGFVEYRPWSRKNRDKNLADGDIAVTIKPPDDYHQQSKPSTKVLGYMAAGLPVVCMPSVADKLVMEHGKTGFFAYTDRDWYVYLKELIEDPRLRERIGKAAYEHAIGNYNIEAIMGKYLDFFDALNAF